MDDKVRSKAVKLSLLPDDFSDGHLASDYSDNHVDGKLHPAFSDSRIRNDCDVDYSSDETDAVYDDKALFDCQEAFKHELQLYEDGAGPSYRTGVDLMTPHTWRDVMAEVEAARRKYKGVEKKGIKRKIGDGWKNFISAAPAIEAWLELLPNNSLYGSVLCGGLTIILEAAVRLGKLTEDTYDALDQIPLRVERAQFIMRTYSDTKFTDQAACLYQTIIDALTHILTWYKRKAGMKFPGSVTKGPAYAGSLKAKMKRIADASQSMNEEAGMKQHTRIMSIHDLSRQTKIQLSTVERRTDELKELQLEARNHLCKVFTDTEAMHEVVHGWMTMQGAGESRWPIQILEQKKESSAAREALLSVLRFDSDAIRRDVEDALRQATAIPLLDQDRTAAIIQHKSMDKWLHDADSGALLVHGNCRRHDGICPTTIASALLVSFFVKFRNFITLYWFCGSHINGPNCGALGMVQSLICQLLSLPGLEWTLEKQHKSDIKDLKKMLKLLKRLLQQIPSGTVVVCIIDGISYYEGEHQHRDTCRSIRRLVKLTRAGEPVLKLSITSPTKTIHVHRESGVEGKVDVIDMPSRVNGAKQGFDQLVVAATEQKVRRLSNSVENEKKGTLTAASSGA